MSAFLFLISAVALCVYIFTLCYTGISYSKDKDKFTLKLLCLVVIFIIENMVIYIYSYLLTVFGYSSDIVYMVYIFANSAYIALVRLITRDLLNDSIAFYEYVLYVVFVFAQVAFLLLKLIAYFYLATSLMFLYVAIRALCVVKLKKREFRFSTLLLLSSIILGVLVIVEDAYVVKYVTQIYSSLPNACINSFSLNAICVIHCAFIIGYCYHRVYPNAVSSESGMLKDLTLFTDEYSFTNREKDIIELLVQGKTNKEIATELYISPGTVKSHTHNIFVKCGVSSKEELFALLKTGKAAD